MKEKLRFVIILICICNFLSTLAQRGGESTYDFLNLTNSARVAALGGNQVGLRDGDLNLVFHNPAALNDTLDNHLTLNFVPYMVDVKYGYAGYARHFKGIGTFSAGIHSINYGTFNRADESGVITGTFSAAEYAINLTYSKPLTPRWTAGIAVKPIISNFESYNSFGLAADIGLMYSTPSRFFSAGMTLKNFGSQLSTYNETYEPLPTDLQLGMAYKLAHAPFRFSLTAQHLLTWDLSYKIPEAENGSANNTSEDDESIGFGDNLARHMVFGVEFMPAKNFYVAAGYNHRRRQELKIEEKASTVGFSWGFGFRIYKFHFAYGSARYHLAGSSNHFSISTNLSAF